MVKNFQADFEIYGVNRHDKSDYEKISGRRETKQSEIGVFRKFWEILVQDPTAEGLTPFHSTLF